MFHKSLKTNSQLPFYKQMITVVQHISLCIIENWSSVTSFSQRRVADRLERRIQSQLCVQQTLKTFSLYLLEEIWTTWFCDNFWVWDNKESKKLKKEKKQDITKSCSQSIVFVDGLSFQVLGLLRCWWTRGKSFWDVFAKD